MYLLFSLVYEWITTHVISSAVIGSLVLGYYYQTWTHDFWAKRGVKTIRPIPILGTGYQALLRPIPEFLIEAREKMGRVFG